MYRTSPYHRDVRNAQPQGAGTGGTRNVACEEQFPNWRDSIAARSSVQDAVAIDVLQRDCWGASRAAASAKAIHDIVQHDAEGAYFPA